MFPKTKKDECTVKHKTGPTSALHIFNNYGDTLNMYNLDGFRKVQSLKKSDYTGLDINGCLLARGNQKSYLGKLRLISGCPNGQVDFGWMLI